MKGVKGVRRYGVIAARSYFLRKPLPSTLRDELEASEPGSGQQ